MKNIINYIISICISVGMQRTVMEVENFKSHKDVGEVWFGEDSMDRVIR